MAKIRPQEQGLNPVSLIIDVDIPVYLSRYAKRSLFEMANFDGQLLQFSVVSVCVKLRCIEIKFHFT